MLELKEVLAKDVANLTDEEKAFLKENAEKMSDEEKTKFAEVIGEPEDGLDVEAVKSLISKSINEALNSKEANEAFAKKADSMAEGIVANFKKGVEENRKKAIDEKKIDKKADDKTRLFLKALLSGDRAAAKALTTSESGTSPDDAQAGLTIPEELRAEVLRIAETQYGIARREMWYLPFSGPGNTRTIPALGTSVSVFWTNEKASKKSTQPKFNLVTQTLKKLAAIVPMTEEILEDSAINLTQLVAQLFAEAVAKEEDLQFFAGTGSPWTGVLNNGSVNQVAQATGGVADLTADDLLDMQDETPSGAMDGAKYYMHRTVFNTLRKLKGSDGQYIVQNPTNGQPGTIWNMPYVLSDAFPAVSEIVSGTPYILFGNLKKGAIFGDKQQLRVKLLEEATINDTDDSTAINLAEQDCVAIRIVERVGYTVALAEALTVLVAGESES